MTDEVTDRQLGLRVRLAKDAFALVNTAIDDKEPVPVALTYSRGYLMTSFWCGRGYAGWDDDAGLMAAVKRHEQSGCKRCRRGKRRFEARIARRAAGLKEY